MRKGDHIHNEGMFRGAPQSSFLKAKTLREKMTFAENKLWEKLKRRKLLGLKFRRQHPLHLYIVDFYCHSKKLVIEIDGEYHQHPEQKRADEERTKDLEEFGLTIIRFTNDEVQNDINSVIKKIQMYLD